MCRKLFVLTVLFAAAATCAYADAPLDAIFADHAVLQRDRPIVVWGRGPVGAAVTVSLADSNVRARVNKSGRWRAVLPAMHAGGPFVLTARGSWGVSQSVRDILLGDVFLCSGQSNMELSVRHARDSPSEIANSTHDTIRMLTIQHDVSPTPLESFRAPLAWQSAAPQTVPDWSAVCFFFARELQPAIRVPIGLVNASWGGSNIRPWMSAAALRSAGDNESALAILASYGKDPMAGQRQFGRQWEEWWRGKTRDRPGAEPWSATPPDAGWQAAPAALGNWQSWGVPELQDFTGLLWYRTTLTLTAAQATAADSLSLGAISQVDQAWINGQPVGNTLGYGTDRIYPLAAGMLHAGDNSLVVNILSTYGGGGLLTGPTERVLRLSGGKSISLDTAGWQYRMVPATVGYPPSAPWQSLGGVTTLYNAMIAPLGPYGFRGVLWYQGESNTGEPRTYQALLAALMADWRQQFGAGLPYLIVQLPNYGAPPLKPAESSWAEVREAQRQAVANDPHAGLAVTIDIGEPRNLHPTNKQDVARRLARVARRVIYREAITPSGPIPRDAVLRGDQIAVEFADVAGGLVTYSSEHPIGFELCNDSAGTCRFAESRIDGTSVMLSIPTAMLPTRVRYCWADSPVCTLFDSSGLPAGPFELRLHR
jgi:sialate O-acetylesterase